MKGSIKQLLQVAAWIIGAPLLLIGCVIVVGGIGKWTIAIVHRLTGPVRDVDIEAEREAARYRAGIAARGGYLVMQAGAAIYHLPAHGGTCAVGRDHKAYSLNLDLPELSITREPCGAPFFRTDRAAIFLREPSEPFKPRPGQRIWVPPPLRTGEQYFEQCSAAEAHIDKLRRCDRLVGYSKAGTRYDGYCSSSAHCMAQARVAGLDAQIYLKPTERALIGPLVDRLDSMIRAAEVKPRPPR